MDYAESVTRDQESRLKLDQAVERAQLRALIQKRNALGPTPRNKATMRKEPTPDMKSLDREIRVVLRRLRAGADMIESLPGKGRRR